LAALASGVSFSFLAVHFAVIKQHAAAEAFYYSVSGFVMLPWKTCSRLG